jgi:hypothetical protein
MRIRCAFLLVFGAGIFSSGCTIAWNAANTLVVEPAHFPNHVEQCLLKVRTRKLAEEAWNGVIRDGLIRDGNGPQHPKDYRKGFIDGFSDYLQNGGNGEPPPLPPRHYWSDVSPQGRQAAEEWFGGFRHGAARAKFSGLRDLILVPVSGPGLASSVYPERGMVSGKGQNEIAPINPESAEKDLLPPPRELDPPNGKHMP